MWPVVFERNKGDKVKTFKELAILWSEEKSKAKKSGGEGGFPRFNSVDADFLPILESMCENVVGRKGEKIIDFAGAGYSLDLSEDDWGGFVQEFMDKSGRICEFLGVKNRFRTKKIGRNIIIEYAG